MDTIKVRIPAALRSQTNGEGEAELTADSIRSAVDALDAKYPGIRGRICDDSGELRRFVNIYVNGEDVRFLQGLGTPIKTGDEVSIIPAVAGGSI
jgi:molybdopterin synthase sulfur carrier subunit